MTTVTKICDKPEISKTQRAYAQHIAVPIYSNLVKASMIETLMFQPTQTLIAYTRGNQSPLNTIFSMDNGFEAAITLEQRRAIITQLAEELSTLIDSDTHNPGGSVHFESELIKGTGIYEYYLYRVGTPAEKVYETR